jgi:hypothetical protein
MFNPLVEDVTALKDVDLENKIQDISRKYHIAYRTSGPAVAMQLAVCLESYRHELTRRQSEKLRDLTQKSDKNLEGLIKVN